MQFDFGLDAGAAKRGERVNVTWDSSRLVNGHTLLLGMSGAGKTHLLKRMIRDMANQQPDSRFHIFDVHGDINIPGASEVLFSEQTPYGLNPLRVNANEHFGGVRKCIANFIRTVNKASPTSLGVKQEAVIRNILLDVYRMRGFNPDNPNTWAVDETTEQLVSDGSDNRIYLNVPIQDKDDAKAFGARWDGERRLWWIQTENYTGGITRWLPKTVGRANPNLQDVLLYANRLLKLSFMGSDQEAVTKLELFNKAARAHLRQEIEAHRRGENYDDEGATETLRKAQGKAVDAYTRYVNAVRTGHEFDDVIRYDSTEVLKSVVDRLEGLKSTGIFKGHPLPFDHFNQVWTYKLVPLERSEKKMLVLFKLQEILQAAMQRGEQAEIRDVLVLDEIQNYVDEDPDNVVNIIAREGRKFGICLLAATQSPELPSDFVSSLATKVILGIDDGFWVKAVSKMRIEMRLLEWIKLHRSIAIQLKEKGSPKSEWRWVLLENSAQQRN